MHEVRVEANNIQFDGFDYDSVGRDRHVDDFVQEAEDQGILHRDFVGTIRRDLRVVMHPST